MSERGLSRDKNGMIKSSALLGFSSVAILAISTLGIPEPARLPLAIFLAVLCFAFAIPFLALRVLAFLMLDDKSDERVNYNLLGEIEITGHSAAVFGFYFLILQISVVAFAVLLIAGAFAYIHWRNIFAFRYLK